ncbi:MAG: aminotransferase class I/II-fold pyridoxal phosphate-dependent enzyme, partial [Actinomycetota bacterium]
MSFDFDRVIDRTNTNAVATDGFRRYLLDEPELTLPCPDRDVLAMWVADMAFSTAPVALEAMGERIGHPVFGYTASLDAEFERAFRGWCQRRYDWAPEADHCLPAPGVVPALYDLVDLIIEPGDKAVVHTPAYEPFESAVTHKGGQLVTSPLRRQTDGVVAPDLDDLALARARSALRAG